MPLEEERKYDVDPSFVLPDLSGCLPDGGSVAAKAPVTLTATYYDTEDLRLARSGASLRYRRGDTPPWTVKLPTDSPGARHEISRPGPTGTPPAELVALVTAYTRGAALRVAGTIRSRRRAYQLCESGGAVLAEVDDDTVSVLEGRRIARKFRQIEVERIGGGRRLLDRVGAALTAAGATDSGFASKLVRAMGEPATRPPDLPSPAPLGRRPRAGEVATAAIRGGVARILAHDPLVRLRVRLPGGDTPVHQMRVGCRRLRSDLRTFGLLVDTGWAKRLRRELGWLADQLGAARDAEVLRARLHRTAAADPLAPLDDAAVAAIDAELATRHSKALDALDAALASDRYPALLDALVEAAATPRLNALATTAAREMLPRLVSRPWRRLAYGARGVEGAVDLAPDAPDAQWHAVRIHGKRARYAVEAVAGVIGPQAQALSRGLARIQALLGEHQDAAIAAETWLSVSGSRPHDHALAVTAGRLYERERAAIVQARAAFPAAWQAASKRRKTAWLP